MIEKAPWIKLKKERKKEKNSFPQWSKSQENRFLQPIQDVQNSKKVLYDMIPQQIDWIAYSCLRAKNGHRFWNSDHQPIKGIVFELFERLCGYLWTLTSRLSIFLSK